MANRLANQTSPYLLQHKDNPVDWYPWGTEALTRAAKTDMPIFLSIGYSACHWCHVMERESFENSEIANILNTSFIAIKVDREERPDIDSIYMDAVQALTGRGGWPMSVFLAPDGTPFHGGTYWPPEQFTNVLQAVSNAWTNKRQEISKNGATLVDAISSLSSHQSVQVNTSTLDDAAAGIRAIWDHEHGGLGRSPKFPQPMVLEFLLRNATRTGNTIDIALVEHSLERMRKGGLYDQIGGGFARYCVDDRWSVPHFEKMLYDNALLVTVYLHSYQITGNRQHHAVVTETLDYLTREMRQHSGGLSSSQDADSEGVEGKFFVWDPVELVETLGPHTGAAAAAYFGVTQHGNFENGKTVLSISNEYALSAEEIVQVKRRLFEVRSKRLPPATDDKVLASWNGLAMSAFAEAGRVLGRHDYVETARGIAHHLRTTQSTKGTLAHTWREGTPGTERFCEDYAAVGIGLLDLYQATFDESCFVEARQLTEEMIDSFTDPAGGFFTTAADASPLVIRPKDITDNAVPSPNSLAADLLSRMYLYTGVRRYHDLAEGCLGLPGSALSQHGAAFGRALSILTFARANPGEVAIAGPTPEKFISEFNSHYLPFSVVTASSGNTRESEIPLLRDKTPLQGQTAAYICSNFICKAPVTNPRAFRLQLFKHPTP